jgi:hypothetical protein
MFKTNVVEKMKTHILCPVTFFSENRTVYNVEKYSGDGVATNDVTIWRIRVESWISKATCTYAHAHVHAPGCPHARTHKHAHTDQEVILIAFPQQQWFRERACVTLYVHCWSCVHCCHKTEKSKAFWINSSIFWFRSVNLDISPATPRPVS